MPPKKQIKFKVKPKAEMEAKPKVKKPIKFKVVKKEEKKEEPKKKQIKFKVKPKEEPKKEKKKDPDRKRSELKRVTGVSRKKVKKGDTAEMAGKLPPPIQKNILKQLKTITEFNINDVDYEDLLTAEGNKLYDAITQAQENLSDGLGYYQTYDELPNVSSAENRFYKKFWGNRDDLTEKQEAKLERIEFKIMEGVGDVITNDFKRKWKEFKSKNKGKTATLEEMAERFDRYLDNTYF